MTRFAFLIPLLGAICVSCGSTRGSADEAFNKEQWEKAIDLYERAVESESDAQEIAYLKGRIADGRGRLANQEALTAKNSLDLSEFDKAVFHARRALSFNNSPQNAGLLRQIKQTYANHLYQQAKAQLDQSFIDDALQSIEEAHKLNPIAEYTSLLQDLRRRQLELHGADFHKHFTRGNDLFDKRQWASASAAFEEAQKFKQVRQAGDRDQFCKLMIDVERTLDTNPAGARPMLQKAQTLGYHREYVSELLQKAGGKK